MTALSEVTGQLKRTRRKAFVLYLCAGDPEERLFLKLVDRLRPYIDILEVGIPFTDSVADGPVIQGAIKRSLDRGTTPGSAFELVEKVQAGGDIPVVLMTSCNIVHRMGWSEFAARAVRSGVSGLIVPDYPVEEADYALSELGDDLEMIFLATPAGQDRFELVSEKSRGFIYYVTVKGTTGTRDVLPGDIRDNLRKLCAISTKPVYAGFGISDPVTASAAASACDGVIIGSRMVGMIEEFSSAKENELLDEAERFCASIRTALDAL